MKRATNIHDQPEWMRSGRRLRRSAVRFAIHFLGLIGMTVIYYLGFSLLFDTPTEYRMKRSADQLEKQYAVLTARYDSLEIVLQNITDRDRSVFKTLFESEPYDFDAQFASARWASYEKLLAKSNRALGNDFIAKTASLDKRLKGLDKTFQKLEQGAVDLGAGALNIPSIQPVINNDLTQLTASYGMRIHPFYKTLASHQGVDYSVPEGSRVFATADGVVRDIIRHSTSGLTLVLSHGNGYETRYAHLKEVNVRKGANVRRGDIIALSGNSGLSLAPHLHYEISHNEMRVDPVHYFFMELTPDRYERIIRIAQSGMQSFD